MAKLSVILIYVFTLLINALTAHALVLDGQIVNEWTTGKEGLSFIQVSDQVNLAGGVMVVSPDTGAPVMLMFYTGWNSPCDSDGFDKCVTAKVDGKVISIKILKSVRASELWIMNLIEVKVADIAYAKEFKIILKSNIKAEKDLYTKNILVGKETVVMDLQPDVFKAKYEQVFGKLEQPVIFGLKSNAVKASEKKDAETTVEKLEKQKKEAAASLREKDAREAKILEAKKAEDRKIEDSYIKGEKLELFFVEVENLRTKEKKRIEDNNKRYALCRRDSKPEFRHTCPQVDDVYVDKCSTTNVVGLMKKHRGNEKIAAEDACGMRSFF